MNGREPERRRDLKPFARRLHGSSDAPIDEETALWRLLSDDFEPVDPPASVWHRIEDEISGSNPAGEC